MTGMSMGGRILCRLTRAATVAALAVAVFACRGARQTGDASGGAVEAAAAAVCADDFRPGDVLTEDIVSSCGAEAFFKVSPVDSAVFARMDGRSYKDDCPVPVDDLRYLRVLHRDLAGRILVGEMVANKSIAGDLSEIFRALYDASYPIERMRLIDDYDADDEASMQANNSSCFNYRRKSRMSALSKHAYGEAVDINPLYNPYYRVTSAGARIVQPSSAADYLDRDATFPYKIERGDLCHRLFLEHGFHWGGSWTRSKDYQHFER